MVREFGTAQAVLSRHGIDNSPLQGFSLGEKEILRLLMAHLYPEDTFHYGAISGLLPAWARVKELKSTSSSVIYASQFQAVMERECSRPVKKIFCLTCERNHFVDAFAERYHNRTSGRCKDSAKKRQKDALASGRAKGIKRPRA